MKVCKVVTEKYRDGWRIRVVKGGDWVDDGWVMGNLMFGPGFLRIFKTRKAAREDLKRYIADFVNSVKVVGGLH